MSDTTTLKNLSPRQWLHYHFLEKKLNSRFGYMLFFIIALGLSFCITVIDKKAGPLAVSVFAGVLVVIAMLKSPYFGFYFLIGFSSLTITLDRIVSLPLPSGTLVEVLTYILLLSVLINKELRKAGGARFWMNPGTLMIGVLFAYYIVELFNPEMFSSLGWISYFKKQFSYIIFYYLCFCFFQNKSRIFEFVRFAILLSCVLALYACKQQWFGYAGFELRAIGTGGGYTLLFQGGMLRKFSVFSDPATSGILFASVALLSIILFLRTDKRKEKIWLGIAIVINLLGYSYAGTRTATVMLVSGIIFYGIATIYERRTTLFIIFSLLVFAGIMVLPYQTAVTARIRSTFDGTKDASAAIRDFNRHQVQPYIQAHPFGGGIFTSGGEGTKYNKGHYLEYLQADSGYLKNLAEQGPVGFALLLIFYFIIVRQGLYYFYRVSDPVIRTYYIGLIVMVFSLMVAQYSQMAISQYPVVLYFYAALVIFTRLAEFDRKESTQMLEN